MLGDGGGRVTGVGEEESGSAFVPITKKALRDYLDRSKEGGEGRIGVGRVVRYHNGYILRLWRGQKEDIIFIVKL